MSDSVDPVLTLTQAAQADQALRHEIAGRLAEVITWPATRISPFERHLAGDVLAALLKNAPLAMRAKCAQRLATVVDGPKSVLRILARDEIAVAAPLLDQCPSLDDADLIGVIRGGARVHCEAIARRRGVSETVTDALIGAADAGVIEAALRNGFARFSASGVDHMVVMAREAPALVGPLLKREELKPPQALMLFWWADADARLTILKRFGVDRTVLLGQLGDLFVKAAAATGADMDSRKALQFIERRQRNRGAASDSPFGSMEGLIEAGLAVGIDRDAAIELGHMAGVRPSTAKRLFTDRGGEALAVMCKATGVKREGFVKLWRALRRPMQAEAGAPFARAIQAYEVLSNAKAQTILRYWDWSFGFELVQARETPLELDPAQAADAATLQDARALSGEWRV